MPLVDEHLHELSCLLKVHQFTRLITVACRIRDSHERQFRVFDECDAMLYYFRSFNVHHLPP